MANSLDDKEDNKTSKTNAATVLKNKQQGVSVTRFVMFVLNNRCKI